MIDPKEQVLTTIYQYLLYSYDRVHEEHLEALKRHSKDVNSRKADENVNNSDLLKLIEINAKVEMFDKIHGELWEILKNCDLQGNINIDK